MSDGWDEEARPASHYEVGYGKPPKEHQFKSGHCPNPRGRPKKLGRSLTPRQHRSDILRVAHTPMRVRTPRGETVVTAIEAALLTLFNKAISGHGPSLRHALKLYAEAVRDHALAHDFKFLEEVETEWTNDIQNALDTPRNRAYLNKMRERTKRLIL